VLDAKTDMSPEMSTNCGADSFVVPDSAPELVSNGDAAALAPPGMAPETAASRADGALAGCPCIPAASTRPRAGTIPAQRLSIHRARLALRRTGFTALAGALLVGLVDLMLHWPPRVEDGFKHPLLGIAAGAFALSLIPARAAAGLSHVFGRGREDSQNGVASNDCPPGGAHASGQIASGVVTKSGLAFDQLAAWALGRPITTICAAACGWLLLTWIPHYLTWPWWVDTDQFAASALAWSSGILPYRDLPDFDFPGPIYIHYALGSLFGWGRTAPLYGVDALFLVSLGVALGAWSRRKFGDALPGLVGYVGFLCYYLSLYYSLVGQRDWRAACFATLGLMALEATRRRVGLWASSFLVAAGFAFRPQTVLFLPALCLAAWQRGGAGEKRTASSALAVAEFGVALAFSLALVFSPLFAAGLHGDFVNALAAARYGGAYNKTDFFSFMHVLNLQFWDVRTACGVAATTALAVAAPARLRGSARVWALAFLGALLYKPISPVPHEYLDQPLVLVRSINLAIVVACVLRASSILSPARLLIVLSVLAAGIHELPEYCSVSRSLNAIACFARGEATPKAPLGCAAWFTDEGAQGGHYYWQDYQRLLSYLRRSTPPSARVANFLRVIPYPTVNGPAGRMSTFPAAGGIMHLSLVDPALELKYIASLVATPHSYVVWVPNEKSVDRRLRYPRIVAAIRMFYEPEARFGIIEVWRHRDLRQTFPGRR
jgi:hypothetical protein